MLIEFSVENFLSFKDKTTLSMEASSDRELAANVVENAQGTGLRLLKSAVVYGANASGKSNLIKSLRFMKQMVTGQNTIPDKPLFFNKFKLDQSCLDKPSTFEVVFLKEGIRYLYGFSREKNRIREEWFYSYPKKRRRVLFERHNARPTSENQTADYNFGEHWRGEGARLAGRTRSETLFISVAHKFNQPLAEIVVSWFENDLMVVDPDPVRTMTDMITVQNCQSDIKVKKAVLQMMQNADLIKDFLIESVDVKTILDNPELQPDIKRMIIDLLPTDREDIPALRVKIHHQGVDTDQQPVNVSFEISEESDGTQKLFALASLLLHILQAGCCLLSDELDLHLHPHLTHSIIKLFHDTGQSGKGGQIIFTTHDVSLLERKLFRRDQIWFTEKNEFGSTELYSAWDYKVRKDESLAKGYLAGRYGAVPYIEKLLDPTENG